MRTLLLAGALAIFGMGAAHAQPTADAKDDTTGMFCVYNALVAGGQADLVANAFLNEGAPDDDVDAVALVLDDAAVACADAAGLSDGAVAAATDMGIYGVAIDHLSALVQKEGAGKRALAKLFSIYDELGEDEVIRFSDDDWRSDADFSGKLKRSLVAGGVPNKDAAINAAFDIFEISALADQAVFRFLVDDL